MSGLALAQVHSGSLPLYISIEKGEIEARVCISLPVSPEPGDTQG